jgi:hypothetical protein
VSFDDRTMGDYILNNLNNDKFYNKCFVKFVKIPFHKLLDIKSFPKQIIFLKFALIPDLGFQGFQGHTFNDLYALIPEYYKYYMFFSVEEPICYYWVKKNY